MVQENAAHFTRDMTSAEQSEILKNPDSFRLFYFQMEGLGQTSRDILTYGDAKWERSYPEDWGKQKANTPFGCIPILYVIKDGKEVMVAESTAVDTYLAKHFGLLGENIYEESQIRAFHSSTLFLLTTFAGSVTWAMPEVKEQTLGFFKDFLLPNWIKSHERHLLDNGDNGHYVGDKLTLADIKTANAIDHFSLQPQGKDFVEIIKKSPALWKVKETVDSDPKLTKWRASEEFKQLEDSTKAYYENPFAYM
ncbi:hypothetical protein BGZ83_007630 [Gryganskiella cystojenkinii]|nr:hypothetical protein BGZ83_007630 [Gryganskiella cystojenkinii]